jgi:glycosyltransferase involved in cell wall biosynthesis
VKVTVAIVTYKRAWALPYSLSSIANQTRKPDEVVIVLKPSGDGSEDEIKKFISILPIKLILQGRGNVTDALQIAIDNADGDLILFIDDDAVAEERWIEKYITLFENLPNAGAISGNVYKGYINNGLVVKTAEPFYGEVPTRRVFYREPLPEFAGYIGWIAKSGFMGMANPQYNGIFKYALLIGVNMAFRRSAINNCPLARLFKKSRKGLWFEQILAYCARGKGYDIYGAKGANAPTVWHLVHNQSLTRGKGFWHEFWLHYDRVANYWRLKKLGANVSFVSYIAACFASLRVKSLSRLLATIYAWAVKI